MRIGSLFSGIGGLELGLERAGVGHVVWQVEIDPYCRAVLEKHWPKVERRRDDIRKVHAWQGGNTYCDDCLPPVDVLCGGYPCQPFSIAGHKRGAADPRHLWPQFARLLRELRPAYAILENVTNHLALGFGNVLGDLAGLGYDAEWEVLSAGALGAHHLRRRVFVIAYRADAERSRPQGEWPTPKGPWSGEQLEGLVQTALRLSVPAGSSGGVSDGIPGRTHRLRALGNAVVPQVAEVVGRRLLQIHEELQAGAQVSERKATP